MNGAERLNLILEGLVADPTDIWSDNIKGENTINGKRVSFYVDMECILCSVCSDAAPNNFRMSDDEDHDICFKQPDGEDDFGALAVIILLVSPEQSIPSRNKTA